MRKLNTFGLEKAIEVLRAGKFQIRCFNGSHVSMGGVDIGLFGPEDVKHAQHLGANPCIVFAFEYEIEG